MSSHPNQFADNKILLDESLRNSIVERLSNFDRKPIRKRELRQAAVAFTILNEDSGSAASFLLTRRPKHLRRHGGQYALPGGRLDGDESALEASLRELQEEIGIDVSENEVLGFLDDYETRSGFVITPVVVWAGERNELHPDPNEVASVFRVPLADLKSPKIPVLEKLAESGTRVLSAPLDSIGHRVFAPTAAFLFQFREVALFGRHTRVAHFDQPKFAWK
jgi:8-oxo-dGTP pyrophosphatase MutT (NUDIX family)